MITAETLLAMSLFALATSATPGPVNIISALSGANYGVKRCTPFVLGATTSFVMILLIVGAGYAVISNFVNLYAKPVAVLGAAYMLYLTWKIARHEGNLNFEETTENCPGFQTGLITQAINPKAWLVSLSAISIYINPHPNYPAHLVIFSIIFFVICALSLSAWTIAGSQLAQTAGNILWLNRVMATLLTATVVFMLYEIM